MYKVMKKVLLSMALCACAGLTAWSQQVVTVNSISQLRALELGTSVVLELNRDTVMPTLDKGLCLCGDMRIRVNAQDLQPMTVVSGTLAGAYTTGPGGKPWLNVAEGVSSWVEDAKLPWIQFIDMDEYESNLAQQGVYVNPWDDVPEDPRTDIPTVDDIKALKQLEVGMEARLKLPYDTVLYVNGAEAYMRDGGYGYAIRFVDMGLNLQQGMVLLGTVVGRVMEQDGRKVFTRTDNTTDQYYIVNEKRDYTLLNFDWDKEDNDEQVDDVVGTGEVIVDSLTDAAGVRRLYAYEDGRNTRLLITDRYGFSRRSISVPARCANLKGILSSGGGLPELYPLIDISAVAHPAGIAAPTSSSATGNHNRYDLQGRRLSAPAKGVFIESGKKRMANKQ